MSDLDVNSVNSLSANTTPLLKDSAGREMGQPCKAWVYFNGTGTVAINDSFNVDSITDNGTGDYTVNFTNAFPDTNYCPQVTAGSVGAAATLLSANSSDGTGAEVAPTTSAFRFSILYSTTSGNVADAKYTYVAVFAND